MTPIRTLRAALLATAMGVAPLAGLGALPAYAQQMSQLQSFAPLVEAAKPAVVTVMTKTAAMEMPADQMQVPPGMPEGMDEFMRRFFDGVPQAPDMQPRQGLGSGFIIDAGGVIVTNNHVVAGAEEITVILDDGTEYQAELVGRDERIDIAVLRIKAEGALPTVQWGDSDAVRVGDWAVAIGNPLGLDGTVTAGIVSARGRDINSGPYDDYLQVDAAINRGNSGGPLFDLDGKVIGVNTAIMSPSGGNVGLGFAIPAEQAKQIVADLLDDGTVERGWIGVAIQGVSSDIAESLGLEAPEGALVAEVTENSPAASAGLRPGDVILGFAGKSISEVRDLTRAVAAAQIGEDASIQVWRGGETVDLTIRPELLGGDEVASLPPEEMPLNTLGLTLSAAPEGGLMVEAVAPAGVAAEAGIRQGDRLLSVNQTDVATPEDLIAALDAARAADRGSVLVLVERDGARRFLTLEPGTA